MSVETPTRPDYQPPPPGPPEEEFWVKYNNKLEFPVSSVAAVLLHVLIAVALVFFFVWLANRRPDTTAVPQQERAITKADLDTLLALDVKKRSDTDGAGVKGSGGSPDSLVQAPSPFQGTPGTEPKRVDLPSIKKTIQASVALDDPSAKLPISDDNAVALAQLSDTLRNKMLNPGGAKGSGPGQGAGNDKSQGSGSGGSGVNSAGARSLRWVLRFQAPTGQAYMEQLAALRAVILIPIPPQNKQCYIFSDPRNPTTKKIGTDTDIGQLAGQVRFSDTDATGVQQIAESLELNFIPKAFWAFFPKDLEDELAKKEREYAGIDPTQIDETRFRVGVYSNGQPKVIVEQQTLTDGRVIRK